MYEDLIKRLRTHNGWALNKTLDEAADAIEELSKEQWQAEGLMMIRDGLNSQMNLTKHRLKHLKEMKKTETEEYISLTTAFKFQSYWFKEADKALNGDLHF